MKRKAEVLLSAAENDDGSFTVVTDQQTVRIDVSTVQRLPDRFRKCARLSIREEYLCSGIMRMHSVVGDLLSVPEAMAKWSEHFNACPNDRLEVGHLNANPIDCNLSNLELIPRALNLLMKRSTPFMRCSGYVCKVKGVNTRTIASLDEAKHAIDSLNMWIAQPYFREFMLQHAMYRPAAFEEHYASVEALLSRAPAYLAAPKTAGVGKKPSKNTYTIYQSLEKAEQSLSKELFLQIEAIFGKQGIVPFDQSLDCIVHYTGARGMQLVSVLEVADYERLMKEERPKMKMSRGYLQMWHDGRLEKVHIVVMGRIGVAKLDGLAGGHDLSNKMDNRKRVLKPQTPGQNNSERGDYKNKAVPGVVGVTKRRGRYVARVNSFFERGDTIYLRAFDDPEEAGRCYAFASANKKAFLARCAGLGKAERRTVLRRCCLAGVI